MPGTGLGQRSVFENLTRDWPKGEREDFARLLAKFADSVAEAGVDRPTETETGH